MDERSRGRRGSASNQEGSVEMSYRRRGVIVPAVGVLVAALLLVAGCGGGPGTQGSQGGTASSAPRTPTDTAEGRSEETVAAENAGHRWAAADTAVLTPGVQAYTAGAGQCTTNYVFVDDAGGVYLGQAAHCAGTGSAGDTDGCTATSLPLDTAVEFTRNGSLRSQGTAIGTGRLAYSSWSTMQQLGEADGNTCAYNDFALVRIDPSFLDQVNPSLPHWGGPTGLNSAGMSSGDRVYSYGNSSLRGGRAGLSPQRGQSRADDSSFDGWTHALVSPTPGIPGDSGSAYLDSRGHAMGTLSTLGVGLPIVNNVGDIGRELAYARAHSGISGLRLVLGTEEFDPNR
ncbi:hypothetical protein ACIGO9_20170 [Nocardia asteroides]|uniref:hypothetical protein n=1 Tax=Nocardia asteroides TaxID=1824 RepID=UPI0037CA195E